MQPVLIRHSMGAHVVQKYSGRTPQPAQFSSRQHHARPDPIGLRANRKHPWLAFKGNITRSLYPIVSTPGLARWALFTDDTSAEVVNRAAARLQDDGFRAYLDMLGLDRVGTKPVKAPILVLGVEREAVLSAANIHRIARAYGVAAEFLPGLGHAVMLEVGWRSVAERITDWLDTLGES